MMSLNGYGPLVATLSGLGIWGMILYRITNKVIDDKVGRGEFRASMNHFTERLEDYQKSQNRQFDEFRKNVDNRFVEVVTLLRKNGYSK